MDEAHSVGIPGSATMMYGHVETKMILLSTFLKL